ncbi:hypothetical protein DZA65_01001 [Dickeya dianthicola]|uniref:Uncharacterized protein n=1 Tax=Dickeya dianthicola TaxID=204039 RepID=A0ABX9NQ30_9GAMM|nr:hypothetical protein [Dickeya dianthicola]AYC17906.1 hypothetical protein DZA65_01001 [Dickeya dianthicola]MBI0438116.1 hypothetical protein [Dickeya dianthicola]MBI0448338.1 hypothetical protein [Dickeya dianthicola]MBI0452999.1 hypothetical protein [Dickeya dianthicola]MBI0457442.1 hypothetical protein [Dickeya dianthicola]
MKKIIITSLIIMMMAYNANAATTPKDTAPKKNWEVVSVEIFVFPECGKKIVNWKAETTVGEPLITQISYNTGEVNFHATTQKTNNDVVISYELKAIDKNGEKWNDAGELHLTPQKTLRTETFSNSSTSNSDVFCENEKPLFLAKVIAEPK